MKKVMIVVMFLAFLIVPLSANAGECERYSDELMNQCFVMTIDDVDFILCFGESVFGPCPCGHVVLSYIDAQEALVEITLVYDTDPDVVKIEELVFILVDSKLILLPEDPWIFNQIVED